MGFEGGDGSRLRVEGEDARGIRKLEGGEYSLGIDLPPPSPEVKWNLREETGSGGRLNNKR
jgi:hypothetical protein